MITRVAVVRPKPSAAEQVVRAVLLAGFHFLAEPDALALGLTSETLSCDRTQARFTVAVNGSCVPWSAFARGLSREVRDDMECPPGLPRHWWVSREPVPVLVPAVTR